LTVSDFRRIELDKSDIDRDKNLIDDLKIVIRIIFVFEITIVHIFLLEIILKVLFLGYKVFFNINYF
jgi:hypothetical protein